jgi:hypothetical protein
MAKLRTKQYESYNESQDDYLQILNNHTTFLWNSYDQNILIMTCQYVHHNLLSMRRIPGGRGQNYISLMYTVPAVTFETGR